MRTEFLRAFATPFREVFLAGERVYNRADGEMMKTQSFPRRLTNAENARLYGEGGIRTLESFPPKCPSEHPLSQLVLEAA